MASLPESQSLLSLLSNATVYSLLSINFVGITGKRKTLMACDVHETMHQYPIGCSAGNIFFKKAGRHLFPYPG
jgi:hypothetical protein